jgi:hypothetical protein
MYHDYEVTYSISHDEFGDYSMKCNCIVNVKILPSELTEKALINILYNLLPIKVDCSISIVHVFIGNKNIPL